VTPDAFEKAARDAFEFLGFDAVWQGGAGRTDVLLTAALGADDQYRVVVDTKSTAGKRSATSRSIGRPSTSTRSATKPTTP
jgi:hypothetical protein